MWPHKLWVDEAGFMGEFEWHLPAWKGLDDTVKIKTLKEVKFVEHDDLMAETFALSKPSHESWDSWADVPEPEPKKADYMAGYEHMVSYMKSGAGFEMRGAAVFGRVIINHNLGEVLGPFTPSLAQNVWNKIHAQYAPKIEGFHPAPPKKKSVSNHTLVQRLGEHIKDFYTPTTCPGEGGHGGKCGRKDGVYDLVQHLNDSHKWPRESIADWLETLDLDLTVSAEPIKHEPVPAPWEKKQSDVDKIHALAMSYSAQTMPKDDLMKALGIETPAPKPKPLFTEAEIANVQAAIAPLQEAFKNLSVVIHQTFSAFTETPEYQALLALSKEINEKKEQS